MSVKDLKAILFNHIRSIKSLDILQADLSELNNPIDRYYLWIIRNSSTELIPKSLIYDRDLVVDVSVNPCSCYEIDVTTLSATPIENIETYIDRCVVETEIQNEYSQHLDKDEYDYDY